MRKIFFERYFGGVLEALIQYIEQIFINFLFKTEKLHYVTFPRPLFPCLRVVSFYILEPSNLNPSLLLWGRRYLLSLREISSLERDILSLSERYPLSLREISSLSLCRERYLLSLREVSSLSQRDILSFSLQRERYPLSLWRERYLLSLRKISHLFLGS